MYVHVIGWETAKKDKIDLEGSKLKEKQGLYTCPPSNPQQLPFHCCLEVKEEQIKVLPHSTNNPCLSVGTSGTQEVQDMPAVHRLKRGSLAEHCSANNPAMFKVMQLLLGRTGAAASHATETPSKAALHIHKKGIDNLSLAAKHVSS